MTANKEQAASGGEGYKAWFRSQQGTAYEGFWEFGQAAWNAALAASPSPTASAAQQDDGPSIPKGSTFLQNLHYFFAQTDGSYAWPAGSVGDLLRQAKREIEAAPQQGERVAEPGPAVIPEKEVLERDQPACLIAPDGPWRVYWHGSAPECGDHVMLGCTEIAYFGDQHHQAVHDLVYQHNCAVAHLRAAIESLTRERDEARRELAEARGKAEKYDAINTPEIAEFLSAVENEALHQRERWGSDHDAGKTDADWFWLVGFLAGKAILKPEKALHHIITTAAALLNWHAHKIGAHQRMRPGIGPDAQPPKPALATSSKGGGA